MNLIATLFLAKVLTLLVTTNYVIVLSIAALRRKYKGDEVLIQFNLEIRVTSWIEVGQLLVPCIKSVFSTCSKTTYSYCQTNYVASTTIILYVR